MLLNSRQSYGLVAQILHWITAVLILGLLILGVYMHDLPATTPSEIETKIWFYSLHKTLGILAFVTAVIRAVWAFFQVHPHALNGERKFETLLASTIHWLLYGSIIFMPVTGWLHHAALEGFAPIWWPFSQDLPFVAKDPKMAALFGAAHYFTSILLMASIGFHILGALKHLFIDRDQTLDRMLPWKKVELPNVLSQPTHKSGSRLIAGSIFAVLLVSIFASQMNFNQASNSAKQTVSPVSGDWIVDHEKSSLDIEIIQNKNPVKGSFAEWQADIIFDPDALDKASVKVTVNTASLTLGGVTKDALSGNFLNVLEFPQAVFVSDRFSKISDGKYKAEGELSITGITKPLTLPFDLKIEGDRAFMESTIELQRLDYNLGLKGYTTDGILGFGVKIEVVLEADKK